MATSRNPFDAIETISEKLTSAKEKLEAVELTLSAINSLEETVEEAKEAVEAAEAGLEEALKASDAAGVACDHLRGIINDARNILAAHAVRGTKLHALTLQILHGAKDALETIDPAPPGEEEDEESDDPV